MTSGNDIIDGSMSLTTLDRFNDRWSLAESGCWTWTGHRTAEGYAVLRVRNKRMAAHRISYEHFYEVIPDGLVIDHLCRNRACVNPDHLEAVTDKVNIARGVGITAQCARKTRCVRGHEFTVDNTRISPKGSRECRACGRIKAAAKPHHPDSAAVQARKADPVACHLCDRVVRRDSLRRHERLVHD